MVKDTADAQNHQIVVTIHDQELLLQYEAAAKFAGQSPVTYVFVGSGAVDELGCLGNVIVARDLADNIESMNYFVDFTSWYACARNRLTPNGLLSLIQYDVSITHDFSERTVQVMKDLPGGILGYCPVEMKNRNFIRDNVGYEPLRDACRNVYGLNIKSIFTTFQRSGIDRLWPATNNVCMHTDTLNDFVRWFTPIANAMGNQKSSGHAFERAIKLFAILSGRNTGYTNEVLDHFQLDSHGTQGLAKQTGRLHRLLIGNRKIES